jgi:hypothetical protein
MADLSFNINDAGLEDGTIDFYTLIQEPIDADVENLRTKIAGLYNEAQANRDHRNLTKRREYQTLLELLPRARLALLEPEKRARYNAYLASAKSGSAEVDYEDFMNDLLGTGETMEEKTGLLGVQDASGAPRVRTIKAPVAKTGAAPARSQTPAPTTSSSTPMIGAAVGFILGAAIGWLGFRDVVPTVLAAIILAALGYAALNRQPRGGIRS